MNFKRTFLIILLYQIDNPIADWHSHRQADTASVTDNFLKNGLNLLYPTYHDLSNLQSGLDNPRGLRFVEFPLYNALSALLAQSIFRPLPPTTAYRLTSVLISLFSAYLIYLLAYKYSKNYLVSFLSLTSFLFLPFSVYYSRAILPEPLAILFMLLTLLLFDRHLFLSSIFFALGLLTKPFIGFVIFPTLLVLTFIHRPHPLKLLIFTIVSLTPFILWRSHIALNPEAIPYSKWLFNTQKQYLGPTNWSADAKVNPLISMISFKPYWFRWLFYERISNLILGSFGLIPLFLAFAYQKKHLPLISFSLLGGILFYFIVVAGGNIQHDYYQALIIPSISLLLGFGFYYLLNFVFKSTLIAIPSSLLIAVFTLVFSFYQIKEYYKINNPIIIEAGQKANSLLPSNALIVAPYNGDTALLYQTHHSGWPIEVYNLTDLKIQHPNNPFYFLSVNFDQYTNTFANQYPTIFKNDHYLILDLNHEK